MRTPRLHHAAASIAVIAGIASFARAQPLETLTLTIEWDKPTIGHGETNAGKLLATVGPEIGSVTAWNSAPGTGQAATLKAFGAAIFNFMGMENGLNGKFEWTIPTEFDPGSPGEPWPTGGAKGVNTGQVGPPTNPSPNVNQTVTLLKFKWTESAGDGPYNVLFQTQLTAAKVPLDVGLPNWVAENAVKIDGQGGFTVIPTPAIGAIGIPMLFAIVRRRRQP